MSLINRIQEAKRREAATSGSRSSVSPKSSCKKCQTALSWPCVHSAAAVARSDAGPSIDPDHRRRLELLA